MLRAKLAELDGKDPLSPEDVIFIRKEILALDQKDFAKEIGYGQSAVSKFESGKLVSPRGFLETIKKAFGSAKT